MRRHTVVLIPGDGIGPAVVKAARRVIEATGVEIEWKTFEVGTKALERYGTTLPEAVLEGIRLSGIALKGPVTTPIGAGFSSIVVTLRKKLGLYANVRPIKSTPGVPSRYQDVDLVVVRENTEGLYSGIERQVNDDAMEAVKSVTRQASLSIARSAFDYACRHRRKMVTVVHKASILKLSDGLFLKCAREVAAAYPKIKYCERMVDALCMDLPLDPRRHDVLLCPNLYGDIVAGLAAGLVGGAGLVPSANIGDGMAIFEAGHGSAPDISGQGIANPTALILAGAMMLSYLGEKEAATRIEEGIRGVYAQGRHLTPDIGGTASTQEMADAVVSHVCS